MNNKNTVIGNCSECGGPVVMCRDEKTGFEYYYCKECGLKKYKKYGRIIDMSKKKDIDDGEYISIPNRDNKYIPYFPDWDHNWPNNIPIYPYPYPYPYPYDPSKYQITC